MITLSSLLTRLCILKCNLGHRLTPQSFSNVSLGLERVLTQLQASSPSPMLLICKLLDPAGAVAHSKHPYKHFSRPIMRPLAA